MKPVIMTPPSNGGPHHATDNRSDPWETIGRPPGASGGPSTETDAELISQLCSFIISIVYLPL